MTRDFPQIKLRLSPELKKLVEDAAKKEGRSVNAEIVHRLQIGFETDVEAGIREERILSRLSIIEGQMNAIGRHIDSEAPVSKKSKAPKN